VFWNRTFEGRCYDYFPVLLPNNTKPMFLIPGTEELTTQSMPIKCPAQPGVYRNGERKWRTPSGTVRAIHTSVEVTWHMSNYSLPVFDTSPLYLSAHVTKAAYGLRQLQEFEFERRRTTLILESLVNYTAAKSGDSEFVRNLFRGLGEGVGAVLSGAGHGIGSVLSGFGEVYHDVGDAVEKILSGPIQIIINIVVCVAVFVGLLIGAYLLYSWLRRRRRQPRASHQPEDHDDHDGSLNTVTHGQSRPRPERSSLRNPSSLDPATLTPTTAVSAFIDKQSPGRSVSLAAALSLIVAVLNTPTSKYPLLPVKLEDQDALVLGDTGATLSLIDKAHFGYLQAKLPYLRLEEGGPTPMTVDNSSLKTYGRVWLRVSTGTQTERVPFVVAETLAYPIILGDDYFFRFPTLSFNWKNSTCQIGSDTLEMKNTVYSPKEKRGFARLAEDFTIPPRHQAVLTVTLQEPYASVPTLIMEPFPVLAKTNIRAAPTYCPVEHDDETGTAVAHLYACNPTRAPVKLYKGTYVAKASLVAPRRQAAACLAVGLSEANFAVKPNATVISSEEFAVQLREHLQKQCKDLSTEQLQKAEQLLLEYEDVFSHGEYDVGHIQQIEHAIPLMEGAKPIAQRPYRLSPKEQEIADAHVESMWNAGILEPAQSPWNSTIVIAAKKDGGTRFCINYKPLNKLTDKFVYPMPNIDEILATLKRGSIFTSLDQRWGYYQIPVRKQDRPKTAFSSRTHGQLMFKRMPFGLHGAPFTFQRAIDLILSGLTWDKVLAYLDDTLVIGNNFESNVTNLRLVLQRFREAGIKLKLSKCRFFMKKLQYLGHVIDSDGLRPDPDNIAKVLQLGEPKNVAELRSFLGSTGFFRRFIHRYSFITAPLTKLLKKDAKWTWTEQHHQACEALKKALTSAPTLRFADYSKPFVLATDASQDHIGACLMQSATDDAHNCWPIAFSSRRLSPTQSKYSTIERELLALVESLKYYRPIIHGSKVLCLTDHSPLVAILKGKRVGLLASPRLSTWALRFQDADIDVQHIPGKMNPADLFSRPLTAQPGGEEEIACAVTRAAARRLEEAKAQSSAVEAAVDTEAAVDAEAAAKAPVQQEKHEAQSTNRTEAPQNDEAPNANTLNRLEQAQRSDTELKDLIVYLETGTLPNDKKAADGVLVKSALHSVVDNVLVQVDSAKPETWRIVVPDSLKTEMLKSHHDGTIGGHQGVGRTYARLRENYVWRNMAADVSKYVLSCDACQRGKRMSRQTVPELNPIVTTEPMQITAIDFHGPLPMTERGNMYAMFCIDLFSRHIDGFALPRIDAATTACAIAEGYFCRYGLGRTILTDKGTNFIAALTQEVVKVLGSTPTTVASWNPSANGAVERVNKTIDNILKLIMERPDKLDWDSKIRFACYVCNTTPATSTKVTPFEVFFGRKARPPVAEAFQYKFNPYRIDVEDYVDDVKRHRTDVHRVVLENATKAQEAQKRLHDRKVHEFDVKKGDQVLILRHQEGGKKLTKLDDPYEGPYVVEEVSYPDVKVRKSARKLQTVNIRNIRKYIMRT